MRVFLLTTNYADDLANHDRESLLRVGQPYASLADAQQAAQQECDERYAEDDGAPVPLVWDAPSPSPNPEAVREWFGHIPTDEMLALVREYEV